MENQQLMTSEIKGVENLDYEHIEKSYCKFLFWQNILIFILIAISAAVFVIIVSDSFADFLNHILLVGIAAVVWLVALLLSLSIVSRVQKFRGYALREKDVSYRSGIIFPSYKTVPISKIQSVEIAQNPILKIVNLYNVVIANGSQGMGGITIHGVRKETAERIKSYLTKEACDE